MKEDNKTKHIVMMAEDTFSPLFWDDEDVGIGDYESFFIGDDEFVLSSLAGLKEWYLKADKYDSYSGVAQFTTEGMEEWINQGYEYAKRIRLMIPKDIKLFYSYLHQFGDGRWIRCWAYIFNVGEY